MVNDCKCDAYILLPCFLEDHRRKMHSHRAIPEINKHFMDTLVSVSQYECIGDISDLFERYWLGDHSFAGCDDEYENSFPEILPEDRVKQCIACSMYLTFNRNTNLGVIIIALPSLEYDISYIADQISCEYIYIQDNASEKFTYLYKYIHDQFGIKQLDVPRIIYSLNEKPSPPMRMQSILAGNAYQSSHVSYHVKSAKISNDAMNNIAEYDFYEAYVSSNVFLYILKNFSDDYRDNIDYETELLFICELILFQNAAIDRLNKKVLNELSLPRRLKLKSVEKMEVEFGKSIIFWNKNIFKYPLVQNLSDNILKAFGTPELLETYTRNQKYLEHIVELRVSQSTEKEGKILNVIAVLLAGIQILPILIEWIYNSPPSFLTTFWHDHYFYFLVPPLVLILLVKMRRLRVRNLTRKIFKNG